MKKKINILLIIFLLSVFVVVGCLFTKKDEPSKDLVSIKFLMGEWPGDLISYLAQEKGFFEKHGANVEIIQAQGFEDMMKTRSEIDGPKVWAYTILDFVKEQNEGIIDGQIILVEDHSAGADAVLAMPESNINTIQDLKGKKIGVEKDTSGEMFLHILLDKANLTFDDVTIVDIASEDIPQALLNKIIDAGEAYEPSITESLNNGAKIIIDSKNEKNAIVDIYCADTKYTTMYQEEYEKFIAGILDAVDFYESNPEEAVQIMTEPYGIPKTELINALKGIELTNMKNNKLIFQRSSGSDSLYILMRKAEKYLESKGFKIDENKFDDYINTNIILSVVDQ